MSDLIKEAFRRLDSLRDSVREHPYDCDCQVGGVDAMSVDTDWLRLVEKDVRAGLRAALEESIHLRESISREIEALPNLSVRHFGTRPLPDLIRKDTAACIARGVNKGDD